MGKQIQIDFSDQEPPVFNCHCSVCKIANKSNDLLKVIEPKSTVKVRTQNEEIHPADLHPP